MIDAAALLEGENSGVGLWSSVDMEHWNDHGLILIRSDMPESMWCRDRFWAPELFFFDGWFYLTFNCRNESEEYRHSHSVGLARSKNVTGPYEILTKEHGLTEGVPGDNNASLYAENGIFYLLCNETHGIHMYKLDPETVTLSAGRKLCGCGADGEWDSIGVEGPCLVKHCGKYFFVLFQLDKRVQCRSLYS